MTLQLLPSPRTHAKSRSSAVHPTPAAQSPRRIISAGIIGSALEWFDFFMYGTAAVLVFGPQFFPSSSALLSTLAALSTFSVGFLARPVGALLFGHLGDRRGRKAALVGSLMVSGAATLSIGLLPTFSTIGLAAPILLVALRFAQGLGVGGESAGAILLSMENAPAGRRRFYGGVVGTGITIGILLSNLAFVAVTAVAGTRGLQEWAWRLPFLCSALLLVVGFLIRRKVSENAAPAEHGPVLRMPALQVWRREWRRILLLGGANTAPCAINYIVIVYFVGYVTHNLRFSSTRVLLLMVPALLLQLLVIVGVSRLADHKSPVRLAAMGLIGLVIASLTLFPLALTGNAVAVMTAMAIALAALGVSIAVQPSLLAPGFERRFAYTGMAMSQQVAAIVGGSCAPMIATALVHNSGSVTSLTTYLVLTCLLSLGCLRLLSTAAPRKASQLRQL